MGEQQGETRRIAVTEELGSTSRQTLASSISLIVYHRQGATLVPMRPG